MPPLITKANVVYKINTVHRQVYLAMSPVEQVHDGRMSDSV